MTVGVQMTGTTVVNCICLLVFYFDLVARFLFFVCFVYLNNFVLLQRAADSLFK